MARSFAPLDLIVVVGLVATVIGGSFLFIAADGILQTPTSEARPVEEFASPVSGTGWLQPVLGQAIVESSLLENQAAESIPAAAAELNRAVLADQWLQQAMRGYASFLRVYAGTLEAEHAGRIQAVMGRSIVNFTQRGIKNGLLSAAQPLSAYNQRMIRMTDTLGKRMDGEFAVNWQPNLGRTIVTATHDLATVGARTQERIGHAIVQLARTSAAYEDARSANQTQLGSLVAAAVRSELQGVSQRRPTGAVSRAETTAAVIEPRGWPEIPFAYLVVGSLGLIGLFIAGLILGPWRPEEEIVVEETIPGVVTRVYRKAV